MPVCPAGNAFTTERMNMKTDDNQILEVTVRTRCEHCNTCELRNVQKQKMVVRWT